MNKKIVGCLLLISIFLISKGLAGLQTFAYFSDKLVYNTTIESGEWETKCNITLELVNQTDKKLVDVDIVAGQDSHAKNNYKIDPVAIENVSLENEESKSYTFDLEHREAFHCNLQWIYFDINAVDEEGNMYLISQVRGKVHNPPGKVKKDGYSTSYLQVEIKDEQIVDRKKNKKNKKNEDEVSNNEVKEMVGNKKNNIEEENKITEEKKKNSEETTDEIETEEKNERHNEEEVSGENEEETVDEDEVSGENEEETVNEDSEVQSETGETNNDGDVVDNETENETEEN